MSDERVMHLAYLVNFEEPAEKIRERLSTMEWDSQHDVVILSVEHVVSVLRRYVDFALSEEDLEEWGNLVEYREDVGFDMKHGPFLRQIIHTLANPALTSIASPDVARLWISQLDEAT